MLAQKRIILVTLDIMGSDDLDLDNINWRELLQLEPGEDIHCRVQEFDPFEWCASLKIGTWYNSQ